MNENKSSSNSPPAKLVKNSTFDVKVFGTLLFVSLLASLATIPYALDLLAQKTSALPMQMLLGVLINFVLLTLPLTSLGLWLGSKVGLGTPKIEAILSKRPHNQHQFQPSILPAIVLGTVGGIFVQAASILSQPYLPQELTEVEHPAFLPSLLGSFGAAVNEEIWLRLGVMTCMVWLGSALMRQQKPSKVIVWSANLLAAFGFGVLHLPLAASLAQGLSFAVVTMVLSLNGFVGLIFGWLYWRHGLLAAMIAHFSTDMVIHVIPALFSTAIK